MSVICAQFVRAAAIEYPEQHDVQYGHLLTARRFSSTKYLVWPLCGYMSALPCGEILGRYEATCAADSIKQNVR